MPEDRHPAVGELAELLHDQPVNPLRPNQKQGWQAEVEHLERITGQPAEFAGTAKGFARRRLQQVKRLLETNSAKKIGDEPRRSKVAILCKRVLTDVLLPRLLTRAESDRNPPGAVGHQLRHGEFSTPFKDAALIWKRGMRALEPDNDDPDFTNYARYQRPGVRPDGTASFQPEAQRPGNFAMSPLAKANWPFGDTEVKSALNEVRAREARVEEAQPPAPAKGDTAERRRTAMARARAVRQANLDAKKAQRGPESAT